MVEGNRTIEYILSPQDAQVSGQPDLSVFSKIKVGLSFDLAEICGHEVDYSGSAHELGSRIIEKLGVEPHSLIGDENFYVAGYLSDMDYRDRSIRYDFENQDILLLIARNSEGKLNVSSFSPEVKDRLTEELVQEAIKDLEHAN